MDFDFSFEQQLLLKSVRGLFAKLEPVSDSVVRPYPAAQVMRGLAALGLFEADDRGAPALSFSDATAIAMEVGRHLPAAPVSEAIAAWLCSQELGTQLQAALAQGRPVSMAVSGFIGAAAGSTEGPAISRVLVPFASEAALILTPFGGKNQRQWIALAPESVTLEKADTVDITIDAQWVSAKAMPLFFPDRLNNHRAAVDDALTLLAMAEMTGAAEICLEKTAGYIRERQQFGKPIGSNQAIKHSAADCALDIEIMKASVEYAGWAFDQAAAGSAQDRNEAAMALLTARSSLGERARKVVERCIQMHGGIAFTWDYGLHCYLRRVLYRTNTLVRPRESRETIAALILPAS